MAKIRGVKPEYWTDDDIVELSIPARLLFIGLWNYACDNGHLQDRPKQIKMRILPGDDVDVDELLDEIKGLGLISRGGSWIHIPNLTKHQKPHSRWWTTCDAPGCDLPKGATKTPYNRGATVAQRESNGGKTADGDGDGDGDVDSEVSGERSAPTPPTPKRATKLPHDWQPTADHEQRAAEAGIDIRREVVKFRAHAEDKGRTSKSWNAAFTQWLIKATEYATPAYGRPPAKPGITAENAWRYR